MRKELLRLSLPDQPEALTLTVYTGCESGTPHFALATDADDQVIIMDPSEAMQVAKALVTQLNDMGHKIF